MEHFFASEKLCDFISTAQKSGYTLQEMNDFLQETVSDFADDLQLGRLSVTVSNPQTVYEPLGLNTEILSYTNPKGFNSDTYEKFYFTEENGFIKLKANLLPDVIWTKENKKLIDSYVDLSYILCSRIRLLNIMAAVKITDSLTGALNLHGLQEVVAEIL